MDGAWVPLLKSDGYSTPSGSGTAGMEANLNVANGCQACGAWCMTQKPSCLFFAKNLHSLWECFSVQGSSRKVAKGRSCDMLIPWCRVITKTMQASQCKTMEYTNTCHHPICVMTCEYLFQKPMPCLAVLTSQLHQASKHREMVSQGWECILWRWALQPAKSDKAIADTWWHLASFSKILPPAAPKQDTLCLHCHREACTWHHFSIRKPCASSLRICQTRYG